MYEAYYGLTGKPFQLNPDPAFYFASKQHRRASAYLKYGIQRDEGFIIVTGDVGAGKTTLVRGLLSSLPDDTMVAANLVTTQLDAEDTLRMVGAAFGVRVTGASKAELLMSLEAFFITQMVAGKRCLLIVDEAQNLTPSAVEELRMLSNFQYGEHAALQTFLVGQSEFRDTLRSPSMRQFRQRVTATCHLGPMDEEDTKAYIEHRLHCVGAKGRPSFDAAAFKAVFEGSGGIPRRINQICDRLLLLGYLAGKDALEATDVKQVVDELKEEYTWSNGADDVPAAHTAALQTHSELANQMATRVGQLGVEQTDARIQRMERSMLRLERMNLETLTLMQKLVAAVTKSKPKDSDVP